MARVSFARATPESCDKCTHSSATVVAFRKTCCSVRIAHEAKCRLQGRKNRDSSAIGREREDREKGKSRKCRQAPCSACRTRLARSAAPYEALVPSRHKSCTSRMVSASADGVLDETSRYKPER